MTQPTSTHIPVELMQILHDINRGVNEVKERIARIEGQDHSVSIRDLKIEIERERVERIKLQLQLENVRTRLAPILVGVSVLAAACIEAAFKFLS